jgi:hypothetical protein
MNPNHVQAAKKALGFFVPYNLMRYLERRRALHTVRRFEQARHDQNPSIAPRVKDGPRPRFSYSEALSSLEKMGCDRQQLEQGSIPEASLDFCAAHILDLLGKRRLVGLHVGNFVGVSLCHLTAAIVGADQSSLMVSIDPNIPHRGIMNPAQKAMKLLGHFGLQRNSLVLTGYSLEKNVSNDGEKYGTDYDPIANFGVEISCESQLDLLGMLAPQHFDFAVIDGNHEGTYLRREIMALDEVLKPGGLLALDDVCWSAVGSVFRSLSSHDYEQTATDGRMGIMRKSAAGDVNSRSPRVPEAAV